MHGNISENFVKNTVSNKVNTCIDCGTDISDLHPNSKRCKICTAKKSNKFEEKVKYIPGFLDDKIEGIHYIKCKICGHIAKNLQTHIRYAHNLTPKEYMKLYNENYMCEEEAETRSNKFKGENNPAYKHGGRFSPWSYKNISKTKEEIDACKEKTLKSIKLSNRLNTKLNYWLEKTDNDIEKAKELLQKRQHTFSLEKCIEKYGKEGYRIWKKRQEKWQNTLKSKPIEEQAEINKKKIYKNGIISKAEQELYDSLLLSFNELKQQLFIKYNNIHYYLYDMYLNNKIIEYNGDYWHANPNKYSDNDIITYPNNISKTVKDIWIQDKEKHEFAKLMGYDLLIIWESDYKRNKKEIIEKCKEFLMS